MARLAPQTPQSLQGGAPHLGHSGARLEIRAAQVGQSISFEVSPPAEAAVAEAGFFGGFLVGSRAAAAGFAAGASFRSGSGFRSGSAFRSSSAFR